MKVCACVIKCLMILVESHYYYLLSISFWICVCLHMLCIKVYRKICVGEAHRGIKTEFDRENHKIQKATKQKPRSPKLDRNKPEVGRPVSYMGRPAHHSAALPRALSTVRFEPNTLYFHMFRFSIRIKLKIL